MPCSVCFGSLTDMQTVAAPLCTVAGRGTESFPLGHICPKGQPPCRLFRVRENVLRGVLYRVWAG
jgi:hypothetical protein